MSQAAAKRRRVEEISIPQSTASMFRALDRTGDGTVSTHFFVQYLRRCGLVLGDPRLDSMFQYLAKMGGLSQNKCMSLQQFHESVQGCTTLVHRAVSGTLIMPDFDYVGSEFRKVFHKVEPDTSGANADYIPQLAQVNPDQFAISITTVDGQQFSVGDADVQFCIQSCSKPISYLVALRRFGQQYVHNSVGKEPSGRRFNEMCLKDAPTAKNPSRQVPHNPMINAGAIMACSMVYPEKKDRSDRLASVLDVWRELSGPCEDKKSPISYDDATYRSESSTADRNWCLGYMMKERKAFPPCFTNLSDTLELYFQICSILSTCKAMSVMAATLANGGLNPLTGKRVFSPQHVRCALPLMLSSGMYDYSGQWSYDIGVPAKSGVGGCVFLVIPNLCGIAIWSPRLDEIGNSARGVHVASELVKVFNFHNFEVFSGLSQTKVDPKMKVNSASRHALGEILFAASLGDAAALRSHRSAGLDLYAADYDARTALHLAAAEGHLNALRFLLENIPADRKSEILGATDRWGGTPMDDAIYGGHTQCVALLRSAGVVAGGFTRNSDCGNSSAESKLNLDSKRVSHSAPPILWAASEGHLDHLIQMACANIDLHVSDYDFRTSMHLAASNGHTAIIGYLISKAADRAAVLSARDRWGGTPHADAVRHGHHATAALLERLATDAEFVPRLADISR